MCLREMCGEFVSLDVDSNETLNLSVVLCLEAVEKSSLEVKTKIVVGEAEEQIIHMKDQVNGLFCW